MSDTTPAACGCGRQLSTRNTSGRCKACWLVVLATDPAVAERRRAGIHRHLADPENREKHRARCAANGRDITEEVREARRRNGRVRGAALHASGFKLSAEQRAENGRKRSATTLAWCPPEWRDKYRELKTTGRNAAAAKALVLDLIAGKPMPERWVAQRSRLNWCPEAYRDEYRKLQNKLGASTARTMILDQVARDERKRLAALTPHERQLERVRAGARLVTVPARRRAEPEMTLGGVSGGML